MLLRYLILIPALGPLVYYLLALLSGWRYLRALKQLPPFDRSFTPPVSILKPVRGVDREAYQNFASMCALDYPEYEIIFAVGEPGDPVIPLIQQLQREFPSTSIRLIVGVEQLGVSPKMNNLCRLVKEAKFDLLVINDSDVRVENDYLRDAVAPFVDPRVGTVTSFFRGLTNGKFAANVDAVGTPTESAASALIAQQLGQVDFALGWTMAITKQRLSEIGGFESMVNHHSDDFTMGNEVARKGYRIALMRKAVWMVFPDESLLDFLKHELRWSIMLKNIRPGGYLGMFLTFGFAWALLVALVVPSWKVAALFALVYLVLRIAVAWLIGVRIIGDPIVRNNLWLVPVRDALNFFVYLASFFSNTVQWRGLPYRVRGASLIPPPEASAVADRAGVE
jgi:ceramide glucosyltransferase